MDELTVFTNPEFGEIRSLEIDGEPWLVGKDVAQALGYSNTRKAIIDHVDEEDKGVTKWDTLGGAQELTIINESGLYSLIFSSQLPDAKKFKRWVTSEVLPSIRKTGGYMVSEVARQLESVQKDFSSRLASIREDMARQSAEIKKLEIKLKEDQKAAVWNPQTWQSDCVQKLQHAAERRGTSFEEALKESFESLEYCCHVKLKIRLRNLQSRTGNFSIDEFDVIADDPRLYRRYWDIVRAMEDCCNGYY